MVAADLLPRRAASGQGLAQHRAPGPEVRRSGARSCAGVSPKRGPQVCVIDLQEPQIEIGACAGTLAVDGLHRPRHTWQETRACPCPWFDADGIGLPAAFGEDDRHGQASRHAQGSHRWP